MPKQLFKSFEAMSNVATLMHLLFCSGKIVKLANNTKAKSGGMSMAN